MRRVLSSVLCSLPLLAAAGEAPLEVRGAMTVDLFQAAHLYEMGAVFVDVRSDQQWRWGHVEGAVHLAHDGAFADLSGGEWPRDLPLVIYCDSELCDTAHQAAAQAIDWGYRNVFYFREGYFAWQLADFPQAKGALGAALRLSAKVR